MSANTEQPCPSPSSQPSPASSESSRDTLSNGSTRDHSSQRQRSPRCSAQPVAATTRPDPCATSEKLTPSQKSERPAGSVRSASRGTTSLPVGQSVTGPSGWLAKRKSQIAQATGSRPAVSAPGQPDGRDFPLPLCSDATAEPASERLSCNIAPCASIREGQNQTPSNRLETASLGNLRTPREGVIRGGRPNNNMGLPGATPLPPITAIAPTIDTIHLSFNTILEPGLATAQNLSKADPDRNVVAFKNWKVRAGSLKGFAGFDTIAVGTGPMEGLLLMIAPPKANDASAGVKAGERQVRVVIGSARCWRTYCDGGSGISIASRNLWDMEGDAFTSLPSMEHVKVRRIDICVDHWGYHWSLADLDRFARRGKGKGIDRQFDTNLDAEIESLLGHRRVYQGAKGATYYIGTRGGASRLLRIYNKVVEAQATGKLPWMEPIWKQEGWDGEAVVWRAEIEHGGDWLQAHGFESVEDMRGCERTLWLHYLESVRHVDPKTATRLKRCDTSEVWSVISRSVMMEPDLSGVVELRNGDLVQSRTWEWKPRRVTEGVDCDRLITQAAGCLLTAEHAVGSIPFQEATPDDIRAEWLDIALRGVQRKERGQIEDAAAILLRAVDRGTVTGEAATRLLSLVSEAMAVADGKRLPSNAAKGQYKPNAGAKPCQQSQQPVTR